MASYYHVAKQVGETMIDIKDFSKYHRHTFNEQEDTMGVYNVKKLNNKRYDFFHENILVPRSTDGKIRCDEASMLWMVYEDAKEVLSTYDNLKYLRPIDEKLVQYWLNEFKKGITDLHEYGVNVISSGYGIVIDYHRDWFTKEKYERIYSRGKTFDEWLELARKNDLFLQGQEMPFDIHSIREKVEIMLKIRN